LSYRTTRVNTRVTIAEKEQLLKRAKELNITLSKYVRIKLEIEELK